MVTTATKLNWRCNRGAFSTPVIPAKAGTQVSFIDRVGAHGNAPVIPAKAGIQVRKETAFTVFQKPRAMLLFHFGRDTMLGKYFVWISIIPILAFWGTSPPMPMKWIFVVVSSVNAFANFWSFGILHNFSNDPESAPDWAAVVNMISFGVGLTLIATYLVMLFVF